MNNDEIAEMLKDVWKNMARNGEQIEHLEKQYDEMRTKYKDLQKNHNDMVEKLQDLEKRHNNL